MTDTTSAPPISDEAVTASDSHPDATIIVPVFDDVAGLRITLKSLQLLRSSVKYEVLICDDCGPPEIKALATEFRCRHIRLDQNSGSYAARNVGVKASSSPYVAFLDADQKAHPTWLDAGIRALSTSDYAGGRIILYPPRKPTSWHRYNEFAGFPVERYLLEQRFAPTANLFVRRKVFEELGLFNGKLRSGGDVEFGNRVHQAGFRTAFAPLAITEHPTRGCAELLSKAKRTGSGAAELKLIVEKQSPTKVAMFALKDLLLVPTSTASRLLTQRYPGNAVEALGFAFIEATIRMRYHAATATRAVISVFDNERSLNGHARN